MSIGVTEELSFSQRLRIELNNLFLLIALPFVLFHLIYNFFGPQLTRSYIITFIWLCVFLVPLCLNHRHKYFISKVYTILVPLMGAIVVHLMHGVGIRLETNYLLLILLSIYFFNCRMATIMATLVGASYVIVNIILFNFEAPLANGIMLPVPYVYFIYALITTSILTAKLVSENVDFNKLTIKQNAILEEKNAELERFTHIATHDLKTPIRNISNFASLMDRNIKKEKYQDASAYLEYIKVNTLHMSSLLEDLLSFSMIERADQERSRSLVDLKMVINKVVLILENDLKAKNAKLIVEELPSYLCNETEFYILFQNLIQNGLKYNKSETPRVEIWHTENEDELQIHFKDNGIGIEKQFHNQIFEVFKRLHSKDEYEGTGFGLGFCEKIVHKYNGRILLESELGKGSTFTISLPTADLKPKVQSSIVQMKPAV